MPAVAAIIQHGSIPASAMEEESSLLVQSITKSGTRETKDYMRADGAVGGTERRNPLLKINIDAYVSAYDDIVLQEPGSEVLALANFATATFGFVPGDGTMVLDDPVITESNSDAAKYTCTVTQYPFC